MSEHRRKRKLRFFTDHPLCCFCGGVQHAVEIDHIPARHLFSDRLWPEGYEFPACSSCNDASADDELLLGAIVRIQVSELTGREEQELEKCFRQMHDRHPDILHEMREWRRTETRRFLRAEGLSMNPFGLGEVYVLELPEKVDHALKRYSVKLGKALYYRHTGRILPSNGEVVPRVFTNTQFTSNNFPLENFGFLQTRPVFARSGKDLSDQFVYRYALTDDLGAGGFLVQFRESVLMAICVYDDAERRAEVARNHQLK